MPACRGLCPKDLSFQAVRFPGDGSCFASSSWAPRQVAAFRNGIADAMCAGNLGPSSPELQSTQASIAISADGEHWFMINASPDLRQQLIATPQLHPRAGELRHTPISGRDPDQRRNRCGRRACCRCARARPFTIYAHRKVLAILKTNSIFNVLSEKNVRRQAIEVDRAFEPALPDGAALRHRDRAVRGTRQERVVSGRQGSPRRTQRRRRYARASHQGQGDRQVFLFSRRLRRSHRRSQGRASPARPWSSSTVRCGATTS